MFRFASNFTIPNASLVDNSKKYIKNVYQISGLNTFALLDKETLNVNRDKDISELYRIIRKGDIHAIEPVERNMYSSKGKYPEYIANVVGVQGRKVVRVYDGKGALSQFKKDIQMMSKIRHLRVSQVFGICKYGDTREIIYHDDGTRRLRRDYMKSLVPLQQLAFNIKLISEHIETKKYLEAKLNFQRLDLSTLFYDQEDLVSYYVEANGNLIAVISESFPGTNLKIKSDKWADFEQHERPGSMEYHELIRFLGNSDFIASAARITMSDMITACHRAVYNMQWGCHNNPKPSYLGRIVAFPNFYYQYKGYYTSGTIYQKGFNIKPTWTCIETDWPTDWCINHVVDYTRVCIRRNTVHLLMREQKDYAFAIIKGTLTLPFDAYQTWFIGMASIHDAMPSSKIGRLNIGFVSEVRVGLKIDLHIPSLARMLDKLEQTELYLIISDSLLDNTGKVLPPEYHWAFNKSGSEPMSDFFAASNGCSVNHRDIYPKSNVSYCDPIYYSGLCALYDACGLSIEEVYGLLNLHKYIPVKPGYFDEHTKDADIAEYFKSPYEIYGLQYNDLVSTKDYRKSIREGLSSLAWIGVTFMEKCSTLRGTVYEAKFTEELPIRFMDREESWEEIELSDIDDAFEFSG